MNECRFLFTSIYGLAIPLTILDKYLFLNFGEGTTPAFDSSYGKEIDTKITCLPLYELMLESEFMTHAVTRLHLLAYAGQCETGVTSKVSSSAHLLHVVNRNFHKNWKTDLVLNFS